MSVANPSDPLPITQIHCRFVNVCEGATGFRSALVQAVKFPPVLPRDLLPDQFQGGRHLTCLLTELLFHQPEPFHLFEGRELLHGNIDPFPYERVDLIVRTQVGYVFELDLLFLGVFLHPFPVRDDECRNVLAPVAVGKRLIDEPVG